MAPKPQAQAQPKGKGRQTTVSPDPDESGQSALSSQAEKKGMQAPQRVSTNGFSQHQLNTLNGLIKGAIRQAIRDELIPQMQGLLADQVANQLSRLQLEQPPPSPTPAPAPAPPPAVDQPAPRQLSSLLPAVDQSAYRQLGFPPLPPSDFSLPLAERRPKLEDIGMFDPPSHTRLVSNAATTQGKYMVHHDVFSFTDTLKLYAELDLCKNLFWKSCLRGVALTWWLIELSNVQRELMKTASLETVCTALIERFKMPSSAALSQLNCTSYMYTQIRNGMHISEHLSTCFRLCRHASFVDESAAVLSTWNTLDPQIRVVLSTAAIASKAQLFAKSIENWPTIYDLAMRWRAPASFTPASFTPANHTSPSPSTSKPPSTAPHLSPKPTNYVTRPYPPSKRIDDKSYLASDRAYVGCDSKTRFLEYEDDPAKSLNREGDID